MPHPDHHGPRDHHHGGNAINTTLNVTLHQHPGDHLDVYTVDLLGPRQLHDDARHDALVAALRAIADHDPAVLDDADLVDIANLDADEYDIAPGIDAHRADLVDELARAWVALDDDGDVPRSVVAAARALVDALDTRSGR